MNGTIIKRDCHVKLFSRKDSDRCWHILRNKCMNERLKYVLENNSHFNFVDALFGLHRQDAFAEEAGHTYRADCQKKKAG